MHCIVPESNVVIKYWNNRVWHWALAGITFRLFLMKWWSYWILLEILNIGSNNLFICGRKEKINCEKNMNKRFWCLCMVLNINYYQNSYIVFWQPCFEVLNFSQDEKSIKNQENVQLSAHEYNVVMVKILHLEQRG